MRLRLLLTMVSVCLYFTMTYGADCYIPGSYTLEESGGGPYSYLFTVDIDTIAGNDTKALEITYQLSGGTTATVCYPPGTFGGIITHNMTGETTGGQLGAISYKSWTANNGKCQGGQCSGGSLDNNVVLPVQLVEFDVSEESGVVYVNWTTASEINHDRYVLERSFDLLHFVPVETVPGKGSPNVRADYTVEDLSVSGGQVHYRLKSIDMDGSFEYSAIGSVIIASAVEITLFPNPTNGLLYLRNAAQIELTGPIFLIDGSGQRIQLEKQESGNRLSFDIAKFQPGVYTLQTPIRAFRIIRL